MITYPPALRRTGFGPPRAIRHFSEAIAEARAAAEPAPPLPGAARPAKPARQHPAPARTVVRLWLPLTPLFLLLAPFALLLTPLLYFTPRICPRPYASVLALGRILLAVGGTDVDVDTSDALVRIRIF